MSNKTSLLLKISGGQLKDEKNNFNYDEQSLNDLIHQIEVLSKNHCLGIVLGGGNIWRARDGNLDKLSRVSSDYAGMLATVMNGLILKDLLSKKNIKTRLFSSINCDKITEPFNIFHVNEALNNDEVVIFVGGTGEPFVTTDTAATIRALNIGSKCILAGKCGVKGVYDKDPRKHKDAVFFPQISYDEIIDKNLQVIDKTAMILSQEHKITWLIFNQSEKNSFVDTINKKIEFTTVSGT